MSILIPDKLKKGDTILFISPSWSFSKDDDKINKLSKTMMDNFKLNIEFSKLSFGSDPVRPNSVSDRLSEIKKGFLNKKFKAIFTTGGGHFSIDLIKKLPYDIIKKNPKIFCGFSDNCILSNAINKKTKLITYIGPNLGHFVQDDNSFTLEYFENIFMKRKKIDVSKIDEKYAQIDSNYLCIINKGRMKGTLIGGNLLSIQLLQGTKYFPDLKNSLLLIEDIELCNYGIFRNALRSLSLQNNFDKINGLIIGKFNTIDYHYRAEKIGNPNILYNDFYKNYILNLLEEFPPLKKLPILGNVRFGHKIPIMSFPIGGVCDIEMKKNKIKFMINLH